MVERRGDRIIFSEAEQTAFSVPPEDTPDKAIEIAQGLMSAAENITNNRIPIMDDSTNRHQQAERARLSTRATDLNRLAHNIMGLCRDDIMAAITTEDQ